MSPLGGSALPYRKPRELNSAQATAIMISCFRLRTSISAHRSADRTNVPGGLMASPHYIVLRRLLVPRLPPPATTHQLITGRQINVPENRIVEMTEDEFKPLINSGARRDD